MKVTASQILHEIDRAIGIMRHEGQEDEDLDIKLLGSGTIRVDDAEVLDFLSVRTGQEFSIRIVERHK